MLNVSLVPSNHITDLVWISRLIDFSFRCIIIIISPMHLTIIIIVVDIEINTFPWLHIMMDTHNRLGNTDDTTMPLV